MDQVLVSFCLVFWNKRMDGPELRPAEVEQLGSRIKLHGTRSQRDHRPVQRKVLDLEFLDVPHHLRFRVVGIKYLMCQVGRGTGQAFGDGGYFLTFFGITNKCDEGFDIRLCKNGEDKVNVFERCGLVHAYPDGLCIHVPEVHLILQRCLFDGLDGSSFRNPDRQGIEEMGIQLAIPVFLQFL